MASFYLKPLPSYEIVRAIFDYEPETGIVRWRRSRGSRPIGSRAGGLSADGYRAIKIDGVDFSEHRIIWLWMTGTEPSRLIDHINGKKADNRFENLREADHSLNGANTQARPGKLKGVTHVDGAWQVQIQARGISYYLGRFKTPEQANSAYAAKARELFGEYGRSA